MTALARIFEEKLFFFICISAAILAAVIFFVILGEILLSALPSLTWYFLTTPESKTPHFGMGIANAIVGTILISICATILAIPIALGTAIYLQKYATNKKLASTFRFFLEVLSGTPSIVVGMFGFLVLVYYLRSTTGGFSLLSGAIALSILIMPVIERAIEEAISKVSREMEEGSYALGATRWQTIRDVTIPISMSGIITGTVLGFGRAAEESAVVVLTAGYSQFMPEFAVKPNDHLLFGLKIYPIQDLVGTLPYSVWNAYENSNVIPRSNAFAAAFVLIVFVLIINITAKTILSSSINGRKCLSTPHTITCALKRIPAAFNMVEKTQPMATCDPLPLAVVQGVLPIPRTVPESVVPAPGPSSTTEKPAANRSAAPSAKPRDQPSITDGFAGIILGSAGMAGFLGFIYVIRILTKDASLDAGSVILVVLLNAIVLGVATFQYLRLKRREA